MSVYLHGIAARNFRGIGDAYEVAAGLAKFNLFIGPNNAGKSTFLDLVSRYLPLRVIERAAQAAVTYSDHDVHLAATADALTVRVAKPADLIFEEYMRIELISETPAYRRDLRSILDWLAVDGLLWLEGVPPYHKATALWPPRNSRELLGLLPQPDLQRLWAALLNRQGGGVQDWASELLNAIEGAAMPGLPEILLIPAFRKISGRGEPGAELSGDGLVTRLAQLQHPPLSRRAAEGDIFQKINAFLREVTNRPEARIEIPYGDAQILVHMDGRILPLESLGTGIHQVVIIAALCTVHDQRIICLEEPELHLHPLLQRRLIDYLERNTQNQYLIATHSAAFLDHDNAAIFRVWQEEGRTRIRRAVSRQQRFEICADLGHRASDLLQANAVLWVEGPSDRIYVRHWLKAVAPELEEGLHYSIMFYGGRLLSHLSAEDEEVGDFIALRELNRNLAILIDSDRTAAGDEINETKARVVREIGETGFAWVTGGREIENYVPHGTLQAAVEGSVSAYAGPAAGGAFDHALFYNRAATAKREAELETRVDKVRVARLVCEGAADLTPLDLDVRIRGLAAFIRTANGLGPEEEQAA